MIQESCNWSGLVAQSKRIVDKCSICKKIKKINNPKYSKLLTKEVKTTPLAEVYMDLIGLYTSYTKTVDENGIPIKLTLATMIFSDPVTGLFRIAKVPYTDQSSGCIL